MSCRWLHNGAAGLAFLLFVQSAFAATDTDVLIVDLYVNRQQIGDDFVLVDADGVYYLPESVLVDWEIRQPWPEPLRFRGGNFFPVNEFPGAKAVLDSRIMQLDVEFPTSLMPGRNVSLAWTGDRATVDQFGLYLDYQLNWLDYSQGQSDQAYLALQPVAFGRHGNISANTIYRHSSGGGPADVNTLRDGLNVLELTYARDDPDNLRSLRVGDIFSRAGSAGRSLRMGGIQLATNFDTQPEFITHPLPRFFGEASVPTALDVYVNGQLRRQTSVAPGSYVLEDMPVVNGSGQFQVVARDALGRQQIYTEDFYASTELLRAGLSDYSISVGSIRENYGFENFDYGAFAATGTWRYGWRENMTVEGHAETTRGLLMAGGATKYVIPAGGVLTAGIGLSHGDPGTGARWQLGIRQHLDILNYSVELSGATDRFQLVGLTESLPELQLFARAGRNFFEFGNVGASVVYRKFHDRPRQAIFSANHSTLLGRSLTLSTYLSYVDHGDDSLSVGIRFSMPLGDRHYASAGFNRSHERVRLTSEFSKSVPQGNGYGYRVGISALDEKYLDAGMTYQSEIGAHMLEFRDSEAGGSVLQVGTTGSFAHLSGVTSFTRQIRDAFAVVNVGRIEGVRVYAENVEIGRTDENGQIFVPGLRPYLRNKLSIAVDDLPLNARVGNIQTHAAPYFKSGVVVNFDVNVANNVMLRVVLPDGTPVPEGAYATVNRLEKVHPVGQDGKLFLQGIDRSSLVTLRWRDLSCDLDVPFPDTTQIIARIGDITCHPEAINE